MGNRVAIPEEVDAIPHTVAATPGQLTKADGSESCVYRSASHAEAIIDNLLDGSLNISYDVFKSGLRIAPDGNYLGTRQTDAKNQLTSEYSWLTYADTHRHAMYVGSALVRLNMVRLNYFPEDEYAPARAMQVIGICSRNRAEWFILDLVCQMYKFVSVPMYETLGDPAMSFVLTQIKTNVLAGSLNNLTAMFRVIETCNPTPTAASARRQASGSMAPSPSPRRSKRGSVDLESQPVAICVDTVISFDEEIPQSFLDAAAKLEIKVIRWSYLVSLGKTIEAETTTAETYEIASPVRGAGGLYSPRMTTNMMASMEDNENENETTNHKSTEYKGTGSDKDVDKYKDADEGMDGDVGGGMSGGALGEKKETREAAQGAGVVSAKELKIKAAVAAAGATPTATATASTPKSPPASRLSMAPGLVPPAVVEPRDVASICYTSGTTGVPKGVLITHHMFASNVAAAIRGPLQGQGLVIRPDDIYMSYLPLAHVLERILCAIVTVSGAQLAIYAGDPRTLLDDIRVAQPTVFASVPRLFMRINDKIESGLAQKSGLVRYLFQTAIRSKIERLREKGTPLHPVYDALVFKNTCALMGGRLRYLLSGGAALEKNIQEKMSCIFCCPILEGYGLTETLGATFIRRADDSLLGHIGMPLPCAEMKLRAVPEMGYEVTTDPPAGELLVRGHTVFPSYFMNPEASAEAIDAEGWFATGDIAVRLRQGGRIKIIDRRKHLFKMSQGEYVSPERLENIYCQLPIISQMFCYGDSNTFNLVAIVTLEPEEVQRWAQANRPELNPQIAVSAGDAGVVKTVDDAIKLLSTQQFIELLASLPAQPLQHFCLQEMNMVASTTKLAGFERIKKIWIETVPFTSENDMLTPTFKLKRNVARQHYKAQIAMMYGQLGQLHVKI